MRTSNGRSTSPHTFGVQIAIFCALVLCVMSGCVIVPVRLPTQIRDLSGKPQKLDFTFLKAGATKREEVASNLAPIDTHTNRPEFFWGRWDTSKWGYGGLVAAPPAPAALPIGGRMWGAHNLLIAFDPNGTVKDWVAVADKNLLEQLDSLDSGSNEPLDLSFPVRAKVLLPRNSLEQTTNPTAELVLSPEFLECTNLKVSPLKVGKITTVAEQTGVPNADYVWIALHTLPKRIFDSPYTMGLDPPTLLLLRRYLKNAHERRQRDD